MEKGPYITDLTDLPPIQPLPKFTRYNLHQNKSTLQQTHKIKPTTRINKNINHTLNQQYYNHKKIKPGITFLKTIIENEQNRKIQPNTPILNINIPQTLLTIDNSYSLISSNNTHVKVTQDYHFSDFLNSLKNKNHNQIYPNAITGIANGHLTELNILLSNQLDSRLTPKNQNQFSSRYVPPFGGFPNSLRIFYTPKNVRNSKPNYAYKAISKKPLTQQLIQRKYKQLHNYIIDFSKQQQIILTLIQGKALKQIENMTQSIITYLQHKKPFKITQITIDWIFAQNKIYYFHNIISIKSINIQNTLINNPQDLHKQQINQTLCKLCNFYFPRNQITKIVTNKLILELILHLKTRNIILSSHISNTTSTSNLSNSSHVCNLCYQLIVAQHQLIDIENQFHSLMNVTSDNIIRVKNMEIQRTFNHKKISPFNTDETMVKWRMMFYLQNVKNVPIPPGETQQNFTLNLKFSDIKQNFQKRLIPQGQFIFNISRSQSANLTRSKNSFNSRSQIKKPLQTIQTYHTNTTTRTITPSLSKQSTINFQKIKLLTFYTQNHDLTQIIMNQDIQFQLLFKNQKFKGESSTLQNFTNKKQCQRHSCEVLLFNQKFQYCNLELNVGIICDGQIPTSSLELTKSQKGHLYFANFESSCSPLPQQWIEVISQGMTNEMIETAKQRQIFNKPQTDFLQNIQSKCHSKISQQQQEFL